MAFAWSYNKVKLVTTVAAVFLLSVLQAVETNAVAQGKVFLFHDKFDGQSGTSFDVSRWTAEVGGGGWGNDELQYYTDEIANVRLDGKGRLEIQAVETRARDLNCWYGKCRFTSARLVTRGKFEFKYGRAEARIKVPKGAGMWPAFWLLGADIDRSGWPSCGEIDIMEFIGREPSKVFGTLHGPGFSGAKGSGGFVELPKGVNVSDDFHDFAVEWGPNNIRWFLDGKQFKIFSRGDIQAGSKWVFDQPFFIILNLAVGGRWPGPPDATTRFPQSLLVDYVRVTSLREPKISD